MFCEAHAWCHALCHSGLRLAAPEPCLRPPTDRHHARRLSSRGQDVPGGYRIGDVIFSLISHSDEYGSFVLFAKGKVVSAADDDRDEMLVAEFQGYGNRINMGLAQIMWLPDAANVGDVNSPRGRPAFVSSAVDTHAWVAARLANNNGRCAAKAPSTGHAHMLPRLPTGFAGVIVPCTCVPTSGSARFASQTFTNACVP